VLEKPSLSGRIRISNGLDHRVGTVGEVGGCPEMGLRGIDIQVAIQRAAEAEQIQQGATAQARAGEAGEREKAEMERLRRQAQSQQTDRTDQVVIQGEGKGQGGREGEEDSEENVEDSKNRDDLKLQEETDKQAREERRRKPRPRGNLDILA
jgi:hypothetical protein